MTYRWAAPVAGLVLVFGLTACGARADPSTQSTPQPTVQTVPTVPTASARPVAAPTVDPLADIDRQLATIDGATAQSQGDLAAGDAAASTSDEGK